MADRYISYLQINLGTVSVHSKQMNIVQFVHHCLSTMTRKGGGEIFIFIDKKPMIPPSPFPVNMIHICAPNLFDLARW